jgi:hypothetical protein
MDANLTGATLSNNLEMLDTITCKSTAAMFSLPTCHIIGLTVLFLQTIEVGDTCSCSGVWTCTHISKRIDLIDIVNIDIDSFFMPNFVEVFIHMTFKLPVVSDD